MTTPASCTTSTAAHFRRVSPAAFREAWISGVSREEMGRRFGLDVRSITLRAKKMGLELRGFRTRKHSIRRDAETLFRAMWCAGVGMPEMAAHFAVDQRTIRNTRDRLGLALRRPGTRPKMTLAQFFECQLRNRMAESARIETAAFINAEMVDQIGRGQIKRVGVVR